VSVIVPVAPAIPVLSTVNSPAEPRPQAAAVAGHHKDHEERQKEGGNRPPSASSNRSKGVGPMVRPSRRRSPRKAVSRARHVSYRTAVIVLVIDPEFRSLCMVAWVVHVVDLTVTPDKEVAEAFHLLPLTRAYVMAGIVNILHFVVLIFSTICGTALILIAEIVVPECVTNIVTFGVGKSAAPLFVGVLMVICFVIGN
jgi:hypothetical protein